MAMTTVSDMLRYEGDPQILETCPSSLSSVDQMARLLGWFSIGLGVVELLAPSRVTRTLGIEGSESMVRACGIREIGAGLLCLTLDKQLGLWSRVAGDGLDLTTLLAAIKEDNPQRDNLRSAMMLVAGISLLDLLTARTIHNRREEG